MLANALRVISGSETNLRDGIRDGIGLGAVGAFCGASGSCSVHASPNTVYCCVYYLRIFLVLGRSEAEQSRGAVGFAG